MDILALGTWALGTTSGIPNWGLLAAVILATYIAYDYIGQFTKPIMVGLLAYMAAKFLFGAPLP